MSTKKTTKRKAKKKVEKIDLNKPFEINSLSDEQLKQFVAHLKSMVAGAGWLFLEAVLKGNLNILEKQIVTKVDAVTGKNLSDEEVDLLRVQHAQIVQLLNTPHKIIKEHTKDKESVPVMEFDPYPMLGGSSPESVLNAESMDTT